ncbi:MAG: hypothetical protein ABUT11_01990 [Leifsonia sp.]
MESVLRLDRVIDLPRVIVADALIDPVLVEGWLHPTLRLADFTDVRISTEELPGGTRATSTRVSVEVRLPEARFAGAIRETWQTRLDQLENLLRGHPVDWRSAQSAPARRLRAN